MSNSESRVGQMKVFVATTMVGLILDQITKFMAIAELTDAFVARGERSAAVGFMEKLQAFLWVEHPNRMGSVEVVENFWHYRYVENPGAAWGFLADVPDSIRTPFFVIVCFVAMGGIIHFLRNSHPEAKLFRVALAMVMSGAIGNLLDRIRLGYVIDFIDWHWYQHHWPTFNIADAFISAGVALLVLDMIINGNLYDEKTSPVESQE